MYFEKQKFGIKFCFIVKTDGMKQYLGQLFAKYVELPQTYDSLYEAYEAQSSPADTLRANAEDLQREQQITDSIYQKPPLEQLRADIKDTLRPVISLFWPLVSTWQEVVDEVRTKNDKQTFDRLTEAQAAEHVADDEVQFAIDDLVHVFGDHGQWKVFRIYENVMGHKKATVVRTVVDKARDRISQVGEQREVDVCELELCDHE